MSVQKPMTVDASNNGVTLQQVEKYKQLGVIFTSYGSWNK